METTLKTYTALLRHDKGVVRLSTIATSPQKALDTITAAEGCPKCAVTLIMDNSVTTKTKNHGTQPKF